MGSIATFFENWAVSIWAMLVDSAFLLLVGIALAGLVHILLNEKSINRLIGGGKRASVFKAALFGVPLPLCSCSVLPVAYQLRKSGLNKGGTVAFLISTPETGVDSIMLTYSLTDPLLTIARPVTAFLTATAAGLTETMFEDKANQQQTNGSNGEDKCSCSADNAPSPRQPLAVRLWTGLKYAFTDLLGDLAPYLLFGYLLAGLVGAVLGGEMYHLPQALQSGWGGYVGAVIIGLPLYICATSSTPLAAALLAAGFSPGAMLVFMMVGPATNIASLAVVSKILKGWAMARYLLTIVLIAVLAGVATDQLYEYLGLTRFFEPASEAAATNWTHAASAAMLTFLIVYRTGQKAMRRI